MPECANCGAFVSLGFAHVFRTDGDGEGTYVIAPRIQKQ